MAFVGDGGFQMTMSELATARNHKLPIKVIVMNNHYLGMVRQWQDVVLRRPRSGVDLEGNPDFAEIADAYWRSGAHLEAARGCAQDPDARAGIQRRSLRHQRRSNQRR